MRCSDNEPAQQLEVEKDPAPPATWAGFLGQPLGQEVGTGGVITTGTEAACVPSAPDRDLEGPVTPASRGWRQ